MAAAYRTRRVVTSTGGLPLRDSRRLCRSGHRRGIRGDFLQDNRRVLQVVTGVLLVLLGIVVTGSSPPGRFPRRRLLPLAPRGLVGAGITGWLSRWAGRPASVPYWRPSYTAATGGVLCRGLLLMAYSLAGIPFLLAGCSSCGRWAPSPGQTALRRDQDRFRSRPRGLRPPSGRGTAELDHGHLAKYQLFEF